MLGSAFLYTAAAAVLFGGLAAIRPLPALGMGRRRGLILVAGGVLLAAAAIRLPAPPLGPTRDGSLLDAAMPSYQFVEFHELRVAAPPERVYAELRQVTADEIALFRLLTWIRNPHLPWKREAESILAAPADRPILDVALGSGFFVLAESPPSELVIGMYVMAPARVRQLTGEARLRGREPSVFKALDEPGFAKGAMNFRIRDLGNGVSLLSTETRVAATDAATVRRFGTYWRTIYPGSALIRRMWLRAIRERAEAGTPRAT